MYFYPIDAQETSVGSLAITTNVTVDYLKVDVIGRHTSRALDVRSSLITLYSPSSPLTHCAVSTNNINKTTYMYNVNMNKNKISTWTTLTIAST